MLAPTSVNYEFYHTAEVLTSGFCIINNIELVKRRTKKAYEKNGDIKWMKK